MLQAMREILTSHIVSLWMTLNCKLEKLLDIVTTFSKDIDMKFGVDKCAYIKINARKQTGSRQQGTNL